MTTPSNNNPEEQPAAASQEQDYTIWGTDLLDDRGWELICGLYHRFLAANNDRIPEIVTERLEEALGTDSDLIGKLKADRLGRTVRWQGLAPWAGKLAIDHLAERANLGPEGDDTTLIPRDSAVGIVIHALSRVGPTQELHHDVKDTLFTKPDDYAVTAPQLLAILDAYNASLPDPKATS